MKALLSTLSGDSVLKSSRARLFVCWLLVLGAVQGGSIFRATAQEDDFSSGNDSKWTRYNPIGVASFSVVNNAYRIRTAPSPDPTTFGPGRAGSLLKGTNYGDYFYLTVDIVNWDDSLHQSAGLLARVGTPGPGTTTGYAFTWDRGSSATSGDVDMSRIDGEVPTGFETGSDAIHLVPGNTYRLVFIGQGAAMEGRVYKLPDTTTPVVVVTGSDPNYTSGQVGLVTFDNSGVSNTDVTFDNFLAADVEPPRIQVNQVFPGLFQLSWPAVPDEWGLQSSPKLPAASGDWVDETDVDRFGDLTIFNIETGPTGTIVPPRFYRLKKKQ